MANQTILLCGGTGFLGGEIARRLAARSLHVRALIRPNTDASGLEDLGVEIARGDLRDRPSLDAAVAGVDTVITTATAMVRLMNGAKDLTIHDVDDLGNANLIEAARRAGVRRFVFASFPETLMAGATDELTEAKRVNERRLRESGLSAVIVRIEAVQEEWLAPITGLDWPHGHVTVYGKGLAPIPFIALGDAAEAMVRLALAEDPPRSVELAGPEAMSRMDAVAAFAKATGRRMSVRRVPRFVLRAGGLLLKPVRPVMAQVMNMMLTVDKLKPTTRDEALRSLGIDATPASQYIRNAVAGAALAVGSH